MDYKLLDNNGKANILGARLLELERAHYAVSLDIEDATTNDDGRILVQLVRRQESLESQIKTTTENLEALSE